MATLHAFNSTQELHRWEEIPFSFVKPWAEKEYRQASNPQY
jgi:hypothetical protein